MARIERIANQGTGSHRYEFVSRVRRPFLPGVRIAERDPCDGRAIAKISDLQTPSDPKTTFTSHVSGDLVNAIAAEARMAVDMRSNSTEELLKLEPSCRSRQAGGGGRERAGRPTSSPWRSS